MRRTFLAMLFALFMVFAGSVPTALAGPILINGSFEIGPQPGLQDDEIFTGSSALLGWEVFGTVSIDRLNPPWNVPDGLHAIDLDGRNSYRSGVSQSFETELGKQYQVQFELSGNPGGGPVEKWARVAVGGFTHDYMFEVMLGQSIDTISWERIHFSFVAADAISTISFTSLSPTANSYGALIDNVKVTGHAPDAGSSLLLLAMSLSGLFAYLRRRS